MTTRATAILAAALALAACKHDGAGSGVAPNAERPRTTSPAIAELLAGVPGDAAVIGFIDLADAPWSQVIRGWPIPLDDNARTSLDRELREYLTRTIGLDVSKVQYVVGFAAGPPPQGGVLIKTVAGTLKMPGGTAYEGAQQWVIDKDERVSLAIRGDIMILADEAAVRTVIDTLAGKRKPVTAENPALVELLRKDSSGAAFALAAIKPKELPLPPPASGLQRVSMTFGARGISAAVEGEDATITWLQTTADQALAMMQSQIEAAHAAALAGKTNPLEGASAIIGAAYAKSLAARVKPRREGNRLSASLDFSSASSDAGAAAVIPMIGILAAVAVPAFMDYMKRSKKSEAAVQLNRIGKSAKRAYAETGKFPTGTTPLVPAEPCCSGPDHHCAAVPDAYAASPVWKALDFEIAEPTLFQYAYRGSPDGQTFSAKAVGDLDCDGISITYELAGTVNNGVPMVTLTEPPPNSD
ncbi:MAG TPA: hypothetical protein VLM79_28520 [Kofleriaceae bacterium]|nr:hypothetical protein [Kofleriaceae bacterium]